MKVNKLQDFLEKFKGEERFNFDDIRKGLLILEIGYDKLCQADVSAKILVSFPEDEVLLFALNDSISSYWPQLALNWIESKNKEITPDLKEALDNVLLAKWAKQDFKHRVKRYLKSTISM